MPPELHHPMPNSEPRETTVNEKECLRDRLILVADDSLEMRRFFASQLETKGTKVVFAGDGIEAVEQICRKNSNFDAVIMDLDMPRMSGLSAIAIVRNRGIQTPILAVTGRTARFDRHQTMRAGASDYLEKPISASDLFERIGKLLATENGASE